MWWSWRWLGCVDHLERHDGRACVARTPHGADVLAPANYSFGEKKAAGQFEVVARRSHGDGNAALAESDLQRFFDGQHVVAPRRLGTRYPANRHRHRVSLSCQTTLRSQ